MVAAARESGLTQSVNITEGGRGGMEQITKEDKAKTVHKRLQKKHQNYCQQNLQKKKKPQ